MLFKNKAWPNSHYIVNFKNVFFSQVSLKDVVMMLNRMNGVKVKYQARLVNVKGPIQYVSHEKGVQITGKLPAYMNHVRVFAGANKSRNMAVLNGSKVANLNRMQAVYAKGTFKTISTILKDAENRAKRDAAAAASAAMPKPAPAAKPQAQVINHSRIWIFSAVLAVGIHISHLTHDMCCTFPQNFIDARIYSDFSICF